MPRLRRGRLILLALAACRAPRGDARPGELPFGGDAQAFAALDRARADVASGRVEEGLLALRSLRAAHPGEVLVLRSIQDALLASGRLEEAREEARADLARAEGALALTMAARVAPDVGEAEALLRRALEREPRFAPARHGLAILELQAGRRERALEILAAVARDSPGYLPARADLAALLYEGNDLEGAIREWEGLLRANPVDARARHDLALVRLAQGNAGEAEKEFRAILAARPDDSDALFGLAAALAVQGRGRAALEEYERLARLVPGDPRLLFCLGVLRQDYLDDPRGAIEAYRAFLASPGAEEALGWGWKLRASLWLEDLERALEKGADSRPGESGGRGDPDV